MRRAAIARRCYQMLAGDWAPAPDCAQPVLTDAATAAVRAGVLALPEPQRAAVLLAYYEGLSYRAVGRRLGIAEGTAKSRLRTALRVLERTLRAQGLP